MLSIELEAQLRNVTEYLRAQVASRLIDSHAVNRTAESNLPACGKNDQRAHRELWFSAHAYVQENPPGGVKEYGECGSLSCAASCAGLFDLSGSKPGKKIGSQTFSFGLFSRQDARPPFRRDVVALPPF